MPVTPLTRFETAALETKPLEIENQILEPETGAFTHRGRLCGLEVGHPETGFRSPALGEVGEGGDHRQQPRFDQIHGIAGDALLGVVADEARGGAEVEDGLGRRRPFGKDMEVGHDIVSGFALDHGDPLEVLFGDFEIRAHLLDGFERDVETEFELGLGQCQPHPPPCRITVAGREEVEHLGRGVPPRQRVIKAVDGCHGESIASVSVSESKQKPQRRKERKETRPERRCGSICDSLASPRQAIVIGWRLRWFR